MRTLTADELGIGAKAAAETNRATSAPDASELSSSDPRILEIVRLASLFGGVIMSGPPGTSKSYYAAAAAQIIVGGDSARLRFVQFHASYRYEDFMLGYAPTEDGFEQKSGPFLELTRAATEDPERPYVLVIDELSRADVGRVFGEALTYIERSKRELPFRIANGEEIKIPSNLIILATMNPFDRGVDEVDAAFERRFAKVGMDPDRSLLYDVLTQNAVAEWLKIRLIAWFDKMRGHAAKNPTAAVGHAYFYSVTDEDSLRDVWDYQLKYLVHRAFRRDLNTLADVETAWSHIFELPPGDAGSEPGESPQVPRDGV
ncbi:McrB family protein [Leifsonia aquatica]|uniref:McrB family protein n=1 Tax=Leifsonia aquatica TaxID=144185 RepID=UPI001F05ACF5|nr:AAA family ATPase [Leifsonia aquatica]